MTERTIINGRNVGSDCFYLKFTRLTDKKLSDYLPHFSFSDYWCFKMTNVQHMVNEPEFINFKHSGYIFFKKDIYPQNRLSEWIFWMKDLGGIQYLSKPTPPFNPQKIKILK